MTALALPAGRRPRLLVLCIASLVLLALALLGGPLLGEAALRPQFGQAAQPPGFAHPFGTDALGRDLLARSLDGLRTSLQIGLVAALASSAIALALALLAMLGRTADAAVGLAVEIGQGLPHLMLLILVAFALGGGVSAVIAAVSLTHWPMLTRILRAEFRQVLAADYVAVSRRFGHGTLFIAWQHLLPQALPQLGIGFLLLIPHAILHEAALTFVGFGIEPGRPSIGGLLSEALGSLTAGWWWLGVFPGALLLLAVLCLDGIAGGLRAVFSAREAQE
jgi:peptide/nickel transport system permease protein